MSNSSLPTFVIPGDQVVSLESFYKVVGEVVNGPGGYFGLNLDALNDCLYGGWGTPKDSRCAFRWLHSDFSRQRLGYEETAHWRKKQLRDGNPENHDYFVDRLVEAEAKRGETLFDIIVQIFRENSERVELILE